MAGRNFRNAVYSTDSNKMITRYEQMLNKVCNMIETGGPIYSTWIRFQIGKNKPIVFDSTSTNKNENLIAQLSLEKSGAGVANSFSLKVIYDAFDYGQSSVDQLEQLDEMLADALSYDFNDDNDRLRGYLQYGYNNTKDSDMVSPQYEFILTNVNSSVDWSTGITTYTFEGTSLISTDCNFKANIDQVDGWKLLDTVKWHLFYYYGDENNVPEGYSGNKPFGGSPKYKIDVPQELINDSVTIDTIPATSDISPWDYCKNLLEGQISLSDSKLEEYQNLSELKPCERPQYVLYITDADRTIHVDYISPKRKEGNKKINFNFTWSKNTSKNIVQNWAPNVDLRMYLIQKCNIQREKAIAQEKLDSELAVIEEYELSPREQFEVRLQQKKNNLLSAPTRENGRYVSVFEQDAGFEEATETKKSEMRSEALQAYKDTIEKLNNKIFEMYDAELTIVGVPADLPIACEVTVKPVILESVSRTAGVYMTTGCTDTITSKGVFSSTLKLLRIRSL